MKWYVSALYSLSSTCVTAPVVCLWFCFRGRIQKSVLRHGRAKLITTLRLPPDYGRCQKWCLYSGFRCKSADVSSQLSLLQVERSIRLGRGSNCWTVHCAAFLRRAARFLEALQHFQLRRFYHIFQAQLAGAQNNWKIMQGLRRSLEVLAYDFLLVIQIRWSLPNTSFFVILCWF